MTRLGGLLQAEQEHFLIRLVTVVSEDGGAFREKEGGHLRLVAVAHVSQR